MSARSLAVSLTRWHKTWRDRRGAMLSVVIALTVLALLAGFASNSFRVAKFVEWPFGCDGFGYLRQARLFQEKGWIGGLDTRIDDDRSAYLVEKMRALGAPVATWAHGIAPHCHHYKERTQRIVLQYPPGTGFAISFFAAGVQAHWAFVLHNFIVLAIVTLACVTARAIAVPLIAAGLGFFVFRGVYLFVPDLSIAPSAACALAAGALTVMAAGAAAPARRLALWGLLGLVIGIATAVRVPNLFWIVGPGAVLGVIFLRRRSLQSFAEPAALGLGTLIGLLPVLAANAVNAGHPLATTYSAGDARPPQLEWDVFVGGVQYYFAQRGSPSAFVLFAAAVVVAVLIAGRRLRTPGTGAAAAMGAVSLGFTVAYMVLHIPRIAYYPFPTAVYAMAIGVFCLVRAANARAEDAPGAPGPALRAGLFAAVLVAGFAVTRFIVIPVSPDYAKPNVTASFEPQAIVWADLMSGPIYYFLGRQAAVLTFMPPPLRREAIEAVARDGVPQYLVAEPERMAEELARVRGWAGLRPAGQAFGHDVYRLEIPAGTR